MTRPRPPLRRRPPGSARVSRPTGGSSVLPLLAVIGVAALIVRLVALRFQGWVTIDGTEYIRHAEALLAGTVFPSQYAPGYPALIALLLLPGIERVLAASLVAVICGALLPFAVWWLARPAVGDRMALLPALVCAVHPELARYSAVTMSEAAYMLALYGALALLAYGRSLAGGAALGFAFAVRPEALLPATVLFTTGVIRALRRRARLRPLMLGLAGFLLLAAPCWLYFHTTHGVWTVTPKIEALRAPTQSWTADEPRIEMPQDPAARFGVMERFRNHGPAALRSYPANAAGHARSLLALWPWPLLVLSLGGLLWRRRLEALPLLHIVALPLLGVSEQQRFVLPLVPSLAILAAVPFTRPFERPAAVRTALAGAMLAGVAWTWVSFARPFTQPYDGWLGTQRDAGSYLAGISSAEDAVAGRKPFVAFYAGRPHRVIPDASYDEIIDDAVRRRTRYIVLPERVTHVFRPQLSRLITDLAFYESESRLELVYAGGYVRGFDIYIFKVLQPGEERSGRPPQVAMKTLRDARNLPAGFKP